MPSFGAATEMPRVVMPSCSIAKLVEFCIAFILLYSYKCARWPGPPRPTDYLVVCLPRRSVRRVRVSSPIRNSLKSSRTILGRDQPATDFAREKGNIERLGRIKSTDLRNANHCRHCHRVELTEYLHQSLSAITAETL